MRSSKHGPDCYCGHCRVLSCLFCGSSISGLTTLGRHVKQKHPDKFVGVSKRPKIELAAKILKAHLVANEIDRLAKRGVRFLPKSRLDKGTAELINGWVHKLSASDEQKDRALLAGLDTERPIGNQKEFVRLQNSIKSSIKMSFDGLPGLYSKGTNFNSEVAGEILKIAYALNRSWSFVVHLLLLYGLNAMAEDLSTTGARPPTTITSASKSVAQKAKDDKFWARNPDWDPEKRKKPYVIPAKGIEE